MNILHVLSQFEVTGAEVYAVTLANAQFHRGHQPIIVSDTLSTPAEVPFVQLPVGRRSYSQRLKNISEISRLIDRNNIHVVHAHSRAASWVSYFATRLTGTSFVSTIHGRQHLHFSSKSFSVYGRHIIAVSESLKEHLVRELGLQSSDMVVVPNGLEIERWTHRHGSAGKILVLGVEQNVKVILFVGRLTGPKGDIVRFIVSEVVPLLEHKMNFVFFVVGGLHVPVDIPELFEETNRVYGRQVVILKDFQSDILPYLRAADLVLASGRVVMESLLTGRPTMAFGETNYHGRITEKTFEQAMKTNFGDTGVLDKPDARTVAADIQASIKKKDGVSLSIRNQLKDRFDVRTVEPRIHQIYEKARAEILAPPRIPVMMYHRVVEKPPTGSSHGIWVTAKRFHDQMVSLRIRGYTPITFAHYRKCVLGNSRLPDRPVFLTFDDGYEDNYTVAFPILHDMEFPVVIFLVTHPGRRTNFWDADEPQVPLMSPVQIREMTKYGTEFGSHTVSHRRLPEISPAACAKELKDSKSFLEDILGSEVFSFAYPYGAVNPQTKEMVEEAGYIYASASDTGPMRFNEDFLEIRRTQVFPWTSSFGFWKKTQPWYTRYKNLAR
ncbi:MAG: hypothetical protein HW374_1375 [Bacteroidetes bacterium]|nr:hypothetical protein [Bacteroidota bacterium]